MPCYNPNRVLMNGDRKARFDINLKYREHYPNHTVINIPCRNCIGCEKRKTQDWTIRIYHESLHHREDWQDPVDKVTTTIPNNCMITLTYAPEHLPRHGALSHRNWDLFMKRFRKGERKQLRYFQCGEYGGSTGRPHHHAILFGHTFDDTYETTDASGKTYIHSHSLDAYWGLGRATVDPCNVGTIGYVAGYVAAKRSKRFRENDDSFVPMMHDGPVEDFTDEHGIRRIRPMVPEYSTMSKKPGLGYEWIKKNHLEVYRDDKVTIGPWEFHPPKYYDRMFELHRPDLVDDIKANRVDGMSRYAEVWDEKRCSDAEKIALADLRLRRDSL